MNDTLTLVLAWVAGAMLGAMFFGGLWWTVRQAVLSPRPAAWVFVSLLLRMGLTLAGMYVVSGGHWERLLLCLMGFVMARFIVMWLTRPSRVHHARPAQEASHAP